MSCNKSRGARVGANHFQTLEVDELYGAPQGLI